MEVALIPIFLLSSEMVLFVILLRRNESRFCNLFEFLPLYCNWIASNVLPKYDVENKTFVEPYLPHNKIGIMHLAAGIWKENKDMRMNKDIKINIKTVQGNQINKSLRFE